MSDTPAAFFRNAIDLNRYSNSVAKQIILRYNDIIINAVHQLERTIPRADGAAVTAPATQARLRALLAQLKESLDSWAGDATAITAGELQGLVLLQTEFVADQLRKALPPEGRSLVRTVEISPQFAQSVVTTDPTQINVVALSDDLFKSVYGVQAGPATFSLTAAKGATITLPNGQVVEKAFRGLATSQAERFSNVVRNGLLSGEPTPAITRRLAGSLDFGQEAKSIRELAQAGGELTKMANSQVSAIVRTSINQVANAASQQVYEANQGITNRYRYVATLDSRTSAICRALDGREFDYGKGPTPPQHFNCRSTTVPVIDYKALGFTPPPEGKRAAAGGMVPAGTTYGEWLRGQPQAVQADVLGARKVPYFEMLSRKHGPQQAIAKMVSEDGTELTLKQLRRRYGTQTN
jgi:SPP1 gp7 family putative phage head morphogenesis protein